MGRVEGSEGPQNLLEAIVLCVKQPSLIGSVGAGGISGRKMVTQAIVAFVLLSFLFGLAVAWGETGLSAGLLVGALRHALDALGSLCVVSFAMYIVAQVSNASVTLGSLFTGLTFVRVLTSCILVGLTFVLAIPALLWPESFRSILGFGMLAYVVLAFFVQIPYIMGVFDAGCMGSLFLSFIASLVASVISATLKGMVGVG